MKNGFLVFLTSLPSVYDQKVQNYQGRHGKKKGKNSVKQYSNQLLHRKINPR